MIVADIVSAVRRMKPYAYVGQSIPCNLCNAAEMHVVATRDRYFQRLTNVVCAQCGLGRVDPMPTDEEIDRYYREYYRSHYQGGPEKPRPLHVLRQTAFAAERLERARRYLPEGSTLLDVGAGSGEFVAACCAAGYKAEGLEPSVDFAQYARESLKAPVKTGTWAEGDYAPGTFDAICANHVVEHLRSPFAAFQRIHSWLKPGGLFFVDVPDISNTKRAPHARWHFGHVHSFTGKSLSMMGFKAGFEYVDPNAGKTTSIVFRKVETPAVDWLRFPEHGREMRELFERHTMMRHYASATPYRRFVERTKRLLGQRRKAAKQNAAQ